jgi:hypothetical protein
MGYNKKMQLKEGVSLGEAIEMENMIRVLEEEIL